MAYSDLYIQLFGKGAIKDGSVIDMAEHGRVGGLSTGQGFKFVQDIGGIGLSEYDYVSMALSNGDATETYTFKSGGSGGTTTNTVVIVYTDSTREVITSVTKT